MSMNSYIKTICKICLALICTLIVSFFGTSATQTALCNLFPSLASVSHYHMRIFMPIFTGYFSFTFVIVGGALFPHARLRSAFTLALITLACASLDLYQLSSFNDSQERIHTNMPFYTTLIGSLLGCSIIFTLVKIKQFYSHKQ